MGTHIVKYGEPSCNASETPLQPLACDFDVGDCGYQDRVRVAFVCNGAGAWDALQRTKDIVMNRRLVRSVLSCGVLLVACATDEAPARSDSGTPDSGLGLPVSESEVEALIASGDYNDWICETSARAMMGPSSHGSVRVCSNRVLSTYVEDPNEQWLRGSAAMKEIYDSETDTTPSGYSYYVKVDDESAGGTGWYWYERRGTTVTADGRGTGSDGSDDCVGCHAGAGIDAEHITTPGSRDFVYTAITR